MESRAGESILLGRRGSSTERSQIPFFAGWQNSSTSFSGSGGGGGGGGGGLRVPYTPSPQPSPRTIPSSQEEKEKEGTGSFFLAGNNHGTGIGLPSAGQTANIDQDLNSSDEHGPAIIAEGELSNTESYLSSPPSPAPSPLPPLILRRLSGNPDDTSSGGELSDASSFAHLMSRKEMSRRNFKKMVAGPTHLALTGLMPGTSQPRMISSGPTILMESTPVARTEKASPILGSMTLSEALNTTTDMQSSPTSSIGPLPVLPARPRYGRAGRSSSERVTSPAPRSGRGINARILNRSTTSSSNSLNPISIKRTISGETVMKQERPKMPKTHVSFGSLRDVEEQNTPERASKTPTTIAGEDSRRSSFPWASPSRSVDQLRRFSYPAEKRRGDGATPIWPSVVTRIRSAFSRYISISGTVSPSARSATSRRMSADRSRRSSSRTKESLTKVIPGKSCVKKVGEFLAKRPTLGGGEGEESPILSPFTHDARAFRPQSSGTLAQMRSMNMVGDKARYSISYHDSKGRQYVMPQVISKKATWLPSEMTRINTPPISHAPQGNATGPSRGFFFDHRKPPGVENEERAMQDRRDEATKVSSASSLARPSPDLRLTPQPSYESGRLGQPALTQSTSRGTLFRRTMRRLHTSSSYNSDDTPTIEIEPPYLGPPDMFRQRINLDVAAPQDEDSDLEYDYNIPDHLPNSPLCPKNAALYGLRTSVENGNKRRACPLHDRKTSNEERVEVVRAGIPERKRPSGRRGIALIDMM